MSSYIIITYLLTKFVFIIALLGGTYTFFYSYWERSYEGFENSLSNYLQQNDKIDELLNNNVISYIDRIDGIYSDQIDRLIENFDPRLDNVSSKMKSLEDEMLSFKSEFIKNKNLVEDASSHIEEIDAIKGLSSGNYENIELLFEENVDIRKNQKEFDGRVEIIENELPNILRGGR